MTKPAAIPKPTPAELDLLRTLWRLGPSSVRAVHEFKRTESPDLTYATVLRLMQVMHGKGLLLRDESERSHVYTAAQKKSALQTRLLDELIHKAFAGSGKDLVMAALRSGKVSRAERAEIKRLLEETRDD